MHRNNYFLKNISKIHFFENVGTWLPLTKSAGKRALNELKILILYLMEVHYVCFAVYKIENQKDQQKVLLSIY